MQNCVLLCKMFDPGLFHVLYMRNANCSFTLFPRNASARTLTEHLALINPSSTHNALL
uniref:Uncharacterized protein n=1 Tax=Anguilla anguilla TaxID=7936 RepID=A0A0E9WJA7_ANGAN